MFTKGKELEKMFETEAAFYVLNTNGREQLCRRLAAIRRKGSDSGKADALFILQNPGQCRPVDLAAPAAFTARLPEEAQLVESKPDYTIHQLMRLMERRNWDSVQVINLTDLCAGDYADFRERQEFMRENSDTRHSIFSPERRIELEAAVNAAGMIIAGWGTKSYNREAAREAYATLASMGPVQGLPHPSHPMFYHPYPRIPQKCIQWLDDMESQLEPLAAAE